MKFQTTTGADVRRENICFTFCIFSLGGFYPIFSSINIPHARVAGELEGGMEWNGTVMTNHQCTEWFWMKESVKNQSPKNPFWDFLATNQLLIHLFK